MTSDHQEMNTIRTLSRIQRRVLGTLIEKGLTTPEQYPLTLKSATTGCNQKSNRDPVTEYSEDDVATALDELREMGLVAEVYTDGGRAPRYRHYTRHKFDFDESQLAIMAELWLRGRQQPGELRTRASRMHRIDSQEQLRSALQGLHDMKFVQSTGPLDRRGVEVDHTLYRPGERQGMTQTAAEPATRPAAERSVTAAVSRPVEPGSAGHSQREDAVADLKARLDDLQGTIEDLNSRLARLEQSLGV